MIEFPKRTTRQSGSVFVLLINVIFLLIVYFLVAGTIQKPDFYPVNIPSSISLNPGPEPESAITVNIDGDMMIGTDFVSDEELAAVLQKIFTENKEQTISIKADSALEAKKLIRIINIIKKSGGLNVNIVTKNYERP